MSGVAAAVQLLERAEELDQLEQALRAVPQSGRGHTILLAGEAGIGKTALVDAFRAGLGSTRFLSGACDALHTPRALGPLVDIAVQTRGELAGEAAASSAAWARPGCPYEAAIVLLDGGDERALRQGLAQLQRLGARYTAQRFKRVLRERGIRDVRQGPRAATRRNSAGLTRREVEVLAHIARGLRNADIAKRLVISEKTVDHHVSAILDKLHARTRTMAAAEAQRLGLLDGQAAPARRLPAEAHSSPMAAELIDHAVALRLMRELAAPDAVEAAGRLLPPGSPPAPGVRVIGSGRWGPEGVLILDAPSPAGHPRLAVVAAAGERPLRDLLLALPAGEPLRVIVGAPWQAAAVAELLDADGARRGRRAPAGAADAVLGKTDAVAALLRDLAQPAGRERHGRFVAEGPTLVGRAVDDGLPVDAVVHTADLVRSADGVALLDRARAAGVPAWRASGGQMGTLTPTRPVPAVVAAVHLRLRDASELAPDRAPVLLVAEDLQNPDNLGMVLRTADAAGVDAAVVAGASTDPLHRQSVRAARGAVGRIPIFRAADLPAWVAAARGQGYRVVGATGSGETGLYEADLAPPVAVLVGNEELGLTAPTLAACTARVAIPMAPGQDSLNVGVAAGVVLFELLRRVSCR